MTLGRQTPTLFAMPTTKPKKAKVRKLRKPISQLKPHPRNEEIRTHPPQGSEEWEALKASLEHDYFDPIVLNLTNGFLVSGHLRTKILEEMGVKKVDVVVVEYDEPTHLARMIAANKYSGNMVKAGMGTLFEELNQKEEFDLQVTGFALPEMAKFIETEPDFDFGDEEGHDDGTDIDGGATEGAADNETPEDNDPIRYAQLIYTEEEHEEYIELVEAYKEENLAAIQEEFDTDRIGIPETILFALRQTTELK